MNRRSISPSLGVWIVLVLLGAFIVVGALWMFHEHASQATTETIRRQAEEESYREGELGHLPGQVPVRSAR